MDITNIWRMEGTALRYDTASEPLLAPSLIDALVKIAGAGLKSGLTIFQSVCEPAVYTVSHSFQSASYIMQH
jgi:hypothetical protein